MGNDGQCPYDSILTDHMGTMRKQGKARLQKAGHVGFRANGPKKMPGLESRSGHFREEYYGREKITFRPAVRMSGIVPVLPELPL